MVDSKLYAINRHSVWLNASGAEAAITEQGGRPTIIINERGQRRKHGAEDAD